MANVSGVIGLRNKCKIYFCWPMFKKTMKISVKFSFCAKEKIHTYLNATIRFSWEIKHISMDNLPGNFNILAHPVSIDSVSLIYKKNKTKVLHDFYVYWILDHTCTREKKRSVSCYKNVVTGKLDSIFHSFDFFRLMVEHMMWWVLNIWEVIQTMLGLLQRLLSWVQR